MAIKCHTFQATQAIFQLKLHPVHRMYAIVTQPIIEA